MELKYKRLSLICLIHSLLNLLTTSFLKGTYNSLPSRFGLNQDIGTMFSPILLKPHDDNCTRTNIYYLFYLS